MSIVLYQGSGSSDFNINDPTTGTHLRQYQHNVSDLLRIRGHHLAVELFSRFPWELLEASNHFNDDFLVLRATVGLEQYEEARVFATTTEYGSAFRQIAATIS